MQREKNTDLYIGCSYFVECKCADAGCVVGLGFLEIEMLAPLRAAATFSRERKGLPSAAAKQFKIPWQIMAIAEIC
jgi:hypothetical protein